jgi:NAD(P)-dependent dehydrogenase (short-subunit alcohol dehydrogenase family)
VSIIDISQLLINVTTGAMHMVQHPMVRGRPAYSLNKASATYAFQLLADKVTPDKIQIISFHPGLIYSGAWEAEGVPRDAVPFDDGKHLALGNSKKSCIWLTC